METINEEDQKNKKNENEDNGRFDFCIIFESFYDSQRVKNFLL